MLSSCLSHPNARIIGIHQYGWLSKHLARGKETLYKGERKTPTGEQPVCSWNGKWDIERGLLLTFCLSLKREVCVCSLAKGKEPPGSETERNSHFMAWPYSQQGHEEDRREGNPGSGSKNWTQKRKRKQGS